MCPGRPPGLVEDLVDAFADQLRPGKEGDGIEVALDGAAVVETAPCRVERNAPVEAEDVGSGLAHRGEQAGGVDSEVNYGHTHCLHFADEGLRGGQDEVAVVLDAQRARPAVKDLDGVGSGLDLLGGEITQDKGELVEQHAPSVEAPGTSASWCGCSCASLRPRSCSWPAYRARRRSR